MKKSRVVSLKNVGIVDFFNRNIIIVVLCLLFVAGVIISTVCYIKSPAANSLAKEWFVDYISFRASGSFLSIFLNSLLFFLIVSLCVFGCGTSMVGVVLVPMISGYLGFRYGSIASYIYSIYELKGIAFNSVILIPPTAIFLVGLFYASRCSVEFSLIISRLTVPKTVARNLSVDFKNYCSKYMVLLVIIVFVALIDALFCRWFIGFFEF